MFKLDFLCFYRLYVIFACVLLCFVCVFHAHPTALQDQLVEFFCQHWSEKPTVIFLHGAEQQSASELGFNSI